MRETKRNAFILPTVIILLVVLIHLTAILMEKVTFYAGQADSKVSHRVQIIASELGLKHAEDWLLSSIEDGFVPRRAPGASGDALSRIEAIRPDGERVPGLSFDKFEIDLYVADTDYESSLTGTERIPLIPEFQTPGYGGRRYYFLRSTAKSPSWEPRLVCEELLSVSLDLSNKIQRVTRLFYRSTSSFK
jgi:hypothetical protein